MHNYTRLILRPIKFIMVTIFYFPCRVLISLIPKNKKLWIFSSWGGQKFMDNGKYFFLYALSENKDQYEMWWVSRNRKLVEELQEDNYPVLYMYSIQGMLKTIRANVYIVTHGIGDLNPLLASGGTLLYLGHATFSMKKLMHDADYPWPLFTKKTYFKMLLARIYKYLTYHRADYAITSSEAMKDMTLSSLDIPDSSAWITGYPRNDFLMSQDILLRDEKELAKVLGEHTDSRVIYFVPTWRHDETFDFLAFKFNATSLIELLEKTNSVVVFRLHPFDLERFIRSTIPDHPRLITNGYLLSDPYPLLTKTDVLITDYSSIFSDFLLFNKPIIFANFDHKGYISERELYWEYDDVTPGPKVSDWQELLVELERILIQGKDDFVADRDILRERIFTFDTPNASQKIMEKLTSTVI